MPAELAEDDPRRIAAAAGLTYVEDRTRGISRRRRGSGFSYQHPNGRPVGTALRTWIESLAIPPAWTDVWITLDETGHILATGRDEAGRTQYLYHPEWRRARDEWKFARLAWFPPSLDRIRKKVEEDLDADDPGSWAPAAAVRLIDLAALRIGHEADSDARGATSLRADDVSIEGDEIVLEFVAKGGVERTIAVNDPVLASKVKWLLQSDDVRLFSFPDGNGGHSTVGSEAVNAYIADAGRNPFTAKDFRTWWGCVAAAGYLLEASDESESPLAAIDAAADALGNTRAVARSSYVAPAVLAAAESGELAEVWARTRTGARLSRVERTVMRVLRSASDL